MEDVLDLYAQPYNPERPLICMDEQPYQLLDHILAPLPMKPGNCEKIDYEYERKGTCSIFMFTEPLSNWRHVSVRKQRARIDWAQEIDELLNVLIRWLKKWFWLWIILTRTESPLCIRPFHRRKQEH